MPGGEGGYRLRNRFNQLNAAGGLAAAGTGVGLGLLLVLLLSAWLLILIAGLLSGSGIVLGGRGAAGSIIVRGALQVADAGLKFVDDAKIVKVTHYACFGLGGTAHDAGRLEVAGAKVAETNAGEVEGQSDGEEGHSSGHRKARLQHGLAERAEATGDAGAEGDDLGGGECGLGHCGNCRPTENGGGRLDAKAVSRAEDDLRSLGCFSSLAAGLREDAFEQVGGWFGPGRFKHLHPRGAALGVGEHGGAAGATNHVEVESGLIGGRESAVERVQEHGFTLSAVLRVVALAGLYASELIEVRHLNHLSL